MKINHSDSLMLSSPCTSVTAVVIVIGIPVIVRIIQLMRDAE